MGAIAKVGRRDPFARTQVVRKQVRSTEGCHWCGRRRSNGSLYRYGVESDSNRVEWDRHNFCSMDCRECYTG